VKEHAEV